MPKVGARSGVYWILNLVNGKRYVGSATECFLKRWRGHRTDLKRGVHHSKHLQAAWNKYGAESFQFKMIHYCNPDDCLRLEQKYIDKYQSSNPKYGYNRRPTAENNRGLKWSEESRKRQSERYKNDEALIARITEISKRPRKPESVETRAKKSAAHKGKSKSSETRANMKRGWEKRKASYGYRKPKPTSEGSSEEV